MVNPVKLPQVVIKLAPQTLLRDQFYGMVAVALYEKAKEEVLSRNQRKIWIYDDAGEWGINFDSDKK